MIEDSYEFRIDEHVVEVRIQQLGNEFELWFDGPWESKRVFVVDEDDAVGFYRWLGRNLGPLGENWKSIVDSENKWPKSMDRDDLMELAEVQQRIIERLRQDMDTRNDILKDIRDSLQNIEEAVTETEFGVDAEKVARASEPSLPDAEPEEGGAGGDRDEFTRRSAPSRQPGPIDLAKNGEYEKAFDKAMDQLKDS